MTRKRSIIRPVFDTTVTPKDGELGAMAKAILYKDLARPPKSMRERLALCRAGLETDGVIGPRSTEVHLHQHAALPPVVRAMLESKMRELSGLPPEMSVPVIDMPPEPLPDTFRAECEPSPEQAAQELLETRAQPLESSLAQLRERIRQGGQVVAEENKRKLTEEMSRGNPNA